MSADEARRHLTEIEGLPFETDTAAEFRPAFALATKHNLSFYDALYLELACRRRAPLATFDGRLMEAARSEGVAWD
jgi:predicted nucleic acid-binding protein